MTIEARKLGRQGLEVAAIGLGCMGMSQWYGAIDDAESTATIHRAIDHGVTLFDSAEAYGPFTNEILIGKAVKAHRLKVTIATKFGFDLKDGQIVGVNSRPDHIVEVVNASLKRLDTDYIDLLYQHRFDPKVPIEDVVGTMARLVEAGKVRFIGLCEVGTETIRRAHAVHPLSVVQSEYSLWERNLEDDILPLTRSLGIGTVGFCPLGRGFLTGTVDRAESFAPDDFRYQDPRLQGENYDKNIVLAARVNEIATGLAMSSAQLAIAWVLHQGDDIVPIPGTKRRKYLQENLGAHAVRLSEETLKALDAVVAAEQVAGPRYNQRMMAMINR